MISKILLTIFTVFSTVAVANTEWEYIEKIDPMTDKDTSIAIGIESNCSYKCAAIVVRADGSVIFKFNQFMDTDSMKVEYRFDKTEMTSTSVNISTDGTAGFLSNYEITEFIAKLIHYKLLTVRGYNYQGTPEVFKVSLTNSEKSIRKLKAFSDTKNLNQLKADKKALEEKLSSIKAGSLQGEIASLESAVETVKVIAGEDSEAYKTVKAQYEVALKKANKAIKQDKK